MGRFEDKVVIVTGSSSGIGRAIAVLFAKEGAKVTICGRNVTALQETENEMLATGASSTHVHVEVGDITQDEVQKRIIESTVAKWEKINVLVNNAGAAPTDPSKKEGLDMDVSVLQTTLDLNLISVLKLTNLATPYLKVTKGEVINISSIVALNFSFDTLPYYSISKAALDQLTRVLSTNLIKHGVRVNSVNPGLVRTKFFHQVGYSDEGAGKVFDTYGSKKECIPVGQTGTPEEIATVVAFLANRSESSYIVGQTIVADGGSSIVMGLNFQDINHVASSP